MLNNSNNIQQSTMFESMSTSPFQIHLLIYRASANKEALQSSVTYKCLRS